MLLIAALQVGTELLVGRNYALALVLITPLASWWANSSIRYRPECCCSTAAWRR